jgi:hypothetical protein
VIIVRCACGDTEYEAEKHQGRTLCYRCGQRISIRPPHRDASPKLPAAS